MDWAEQCAVVIPCLNEEARIGQVVSAVRRQLPSVIVVDDGSGDDTSTTAQAAGAEVVSLPHNRGKGAALRAGWRRARERGFNWALTMDGDGQHAPEDIPCLLDRAAETGAALVVGNRMGQAERMPWLRRQVNRWMTLRIARLVRVPLADSQCGFRLMQLEALERLQLTADRFLIESETLVAFVAAGHRVEFVPVQAISSNRRSRIRPLPDTGRWLAWWWRQRRRGVK